MKLDREQIVKALGDWKYNLCVSCKDGDCERCVSKLLGNALALIRELTEEIESLREMNKALEAGFETIKADIARAIFEEIKSKSGVCYASTNDVEIYSTRRYSIMATELDEIEKKYTGGEG